MDRLSRHAHCVSVLEVSEVSAAPRVAGSCRLGENVAVLEVSEVSDAPRVAGSRRLGESVSVLEVSEVSAAPRVAGARRNDDVDLVLAQRPLRRRGRVLATASESERIIGLRESDFPPLVSRCMSSHNSRIHGESSRVCVGPFSCSAAGVSASASAFGVRSMCRALAMHVSG